MLLRKKLLERSRLYAIIDKSVCSESGVFTVAGQLRNCRDLIVQFRDKHSSYLEFFHDAQRVRKILQATGNLFIINDSLEIARIINSDGVHLGQLDEPVSVAREVLGKDKIIGISCSNLKEAKVAERGGADYIGVGPIFPTETKDIDKAFGLALLAEIKGKIKIPAFAIGGINEVNLPEVLAYGVWGAAICRDICTAKDIPLKVRKLKRIIKNS
jgi:thiamine-phosphate pyrophosphorylase